MKRKIGPTSISSKYPDQRVGIFVDVSNLYYSAKNLYKSKVNFAEIRHAATADRKLIRAIAYAVRSGQEMEEPFFQALANSGYEVKTKDLQVFYGGAKKGDWDIGMAMDMIEMAPKLDVVILVSGDGDFVSLLQHLRRALSVKVEVVAFSRSASAKLIEEADSFLDLCEDRKFLLK